MIKKFNKFIGLTIFTSIMFAIVGVLLVCFPQISIKVVSYIIAFSLLTCGIVLICDYRSSILLTNFFSTGILDICLGLIILIYPDSLVILIPILLGIWMIINSIVNIQLSLTLRKIGYSAWILTTILSIITIVCGSLIIINPQSSALTLTTFFGILLIVYSVSDLIDLCIFKSNVNDIVKLIKE